VPSLPSDRSSDRICDRLSDPYAIGCDRMRCPHAIGHPIAYAIGMRSGPTGRGELTPMPTPCFPDRFAASREVAALSSDAFRLLVLAYFWCADNRTDGVVPRADLDLIAPRMLSREQAAEECAQLGILHPARDKCGSTDCTGYQDVDGWVIHDYLADNPSRAAIETREAAAKTVQAGKSSGGRHGNHRRWHTQRGLVDPECEYCAGQPPGGATPIRGRTDTAPPIAYPIGDAIAPPIGDAIGGPIPHAGARTLTLTLTERPKSKSSKSKSTRETTRPAATQPPLLGVAPANPATDDDPTQQVIDAIYLATGQNVDETQARKVSAEILGKARNPVHDQAAFVLAAIAREAETGDPRGRFLPSAGPLLASGRKSGPHEFDLNPETGVCRCKAFKGDKIHRPEAAQCQAI